ncbi:MAG: polysaccharide deacetylase family protein [Draconibacterium sp.]
MILIYSEKITPRIEYISKLIFNQVLQAEVAFTKNSKDFQQHEGPKFNYSFQKFGDEFYIKPHRLMFQKALIKPTIHPVWYEGNKYFCESTQDSELPFDPLAASFYLVTRHEEYTDKNRDKLNRYTPQNSILLKYNLFQKPVVNIWARLLGQKLKEKYPELNFTETKFDFISSIDIDNAWAYKHKGFWRTGGALVKSFFRNRSEFKARINVVSGKSKDPYDTYDYLDTVFAGNEEKVKFFFLMGDWGRYDKNISSRNKHYKKLIRATKEKYDIALHPSFSSSKKGNRKKTRIERIRLEKIIKSNILKSRQHFLRLELPKSYRRLIKSGIIEDYTMGFSCLHGFRAGICTPYYFYDLERETATNLLVVPFQVMDGTFKHYLKLSPDKAFEEIKKIMTEVKNVGGTFVSVWHNETVNDLGIWEGYREVFEKMNQLGFEWANDKN